jgi:hypothetical protein
MADKPIRIQRKRIKGWKMPENTVYVGRPTKWGNPWDGGDDAARLFRAAILGFTSNGDFCKPVAHPESRIGTIIRCAPVELRGKNLACWCRLDQPCHADVLLEIANREAA